MMNSRGTDDLLEGEAADASRVPGGPAATARAAGREPAAAGALPAHKSLRARAWMATLALLVYFALSVAYVNHERGRIYDTIQALQQNLRHEKALALVEASVGGALVEVTELGDASRAEPAPPSELRLYMESCERLFAALEPFDPGYTLQQRAITRSYAALEASPTRSNWIDLREVLKRVSDEFDIRHHRLADERETVTAEFRRHYDAVTIETLAFAVVGVLGFGTIAAWFFTRLARDVVHLEEHARQIVQGRRGVALTVDRQDELGHLMHAVNRMARDLDEREKQIELDGQRRSHHDKMLAVGALAAGVAHEVNNPLAVISGVAEELRGADGPLAAERVADSAQLILAQTQRATQATRQLAELAAPQPAELDWTDLNELVRRVVRLMGYDRRYRRIAFDVVADPALPAIRTSGDAVQRVLMQIVSLACDSLVAADNAALRVDVSTTAAAGGGVDVMLRFAPVLDFGRAEVQRSLLLARATVEPLGGRLAFGQADGPSLRIKLSLPAEAAVQERQ